VWVPGVMLSCQALGEGWAVYSWPAPTLHLERQALATSDTAELPKLAQLTPNAERDRSLAVAARRFGFGLERHRPEDRLLDLAIAGEALFLRDTKSESAHKFAERGAQLLEQDPTARRALFSFLKRV